MRKYIALIEEDNGNYGVIFPDLPRVTSSGNDYEEAIKNAHEILAYFAETIVLPTSRTLEQIEKTWTDWQEWKENYKFIATYITVLPISTKTKRINIIMNEGLLAKVDMVAKNRSEFICNAVENALNGAASN
jgi:predicted RNase H-like HicB family nuclease